MARDIVLFLGAGFSHEAALPTMVNFGKESEREYKDLSKEGTKGEIFLKAGEIFKGFQEYGKSAKQFCDIDIINMEEIFCVAEALKEAGISPLRINNKDIHTVDLIESIKLWLWKIYHQCPPLNPEKQPLVKEKTYNSFFTFLREEGLQSHVGIITTNYDLLFEYYAWTHKMLCCYPFKGIGKPINVVDRINPESFVELEQNKKNPLICKIHGSINYFTNQKSGSDTLLIANDIGKPGDSIGIPTPARPAIFMVKALDHLMQKESNLSLSIIPPTYSKLHQYKWLQQTWKTSIELIKNARKIIFIGYSLPRSDGFVRSMIQSAMILREKNTVLNVYVIDPDPDKKVEKNYNELFNNKVDFISMGLSESWNKDEIIRALTE